MKMLENHGHAIRKAATTVFTLACAVLFVAPVTAQEIQPEQQAQPATEVSDNELEAFARAHVKVLEIQNQMNADVQGAQSAEEAQAIQQQAGEKMVTAIESHDLSPDRFTQIVDAINADPQVGERFNEVLQEVAGGQAAPAQR